MLKKLSTVALVILSVGIGTTAIADTRMASDLILASTGEMLPETSAKVRTVSDQLDRISARCAGSRGANIGDKLGMAFSKLHAKNNLYGYINDIEKITARQCGSYDDSTLLTLYVLERNEGASAAATVKNVSENPQRLVRKWSSRKAS